jgi:hypothetical protein
MQDVFLISLALGAGVLIVQIVLDLFGAGQDAPGVPHHTGAGDGLDLLSVRSIAAGATLLGAVGLWLTVRGLPFVVALAGGLVAGFGAAVGTAWVTRQLLRLESSGSLRLENAVGEAGTVYLPVPAKRQGTGKIQLRLQGRTVELGAVADEADIIPTGAAVVVVSVLDGETVEVIPTPRLEGTET